MISLVLAFPASAGVFQLQAAQPVVGAVLHGEDAPLLLYFRSKDCTSCATVDEYFQDSATKARIEKQYVAVCLNVDDRAGRACADIYRVTSVPALVIADRKGKVLFRSAPHHTDEELCRIIDALQALPALIADGDLNGNTTATHTRHAEEAPTRLATLTTHPLTVQNAPLRQVHAEPEFPPAPAPVMESTDSVSAPSETVKVVESTGRATLSPGSQRIWRYAIQIGYFSLEPYADKLVSQALNSGLAEVRVDRSTRNGQTYHRVLTGTFASLAEAQQYLDQVTAQGFKAAIHRW